MSDLFLRACRGEPVERTPVWLMRQAGRYLPEYREVRAGADFVQLCTTPELAAEVTLQPIRRFGMDAAILFSDILVPAQALGIKMRFEPGPVLDPPVRTRADVGRLQACDPEEDLPYVFETIRILRRELAVPLIGFAAAPFTLAAYLVEGRGSSGFERLRAMLYGDPLLAHDLLERTASLTGRYLTGQVRAGAQAIQLFDSWAGLLAPAEYREFALRHAARVIGEVRGEGVPVLYFALNAGHLLEEIRDCGADVVGLDWRTDLDVASRRLGNRFVVQGNLDPSVLFAPADTIARRALRVLEQGASAPGHVFNLGHGVLPETPVEHVQALVETVRTAPAPARPARTP